MYAAIDRDLASVVTGIVVVLTALAVEYDAVRAHLDDEVEELVHEDGTRVECGRLAGTDWRLALAELGEGAVNASALTAQVESSGKNRVAEHFFVASSHATISRFSTDEAHCASRSQVEPSGSLPAKTFAHGARSSGAA